MGVVPFVVAEPLLHLHPVNQISKNLGLSKKNYN